jgi:chemotaxis protein histidine kinase CheA
MPDASEFSSDEMRVLRRLFVTSGRDYLIRFRGALESMTREAASDETLELFHRSIHSLKGAALQLGLLHVGTLAKEMEGVAKAVRETQAALPDDGVALLTEGMVRLTDYLIDVEKETETAEPPADLLRRLQLLADSVRVAGTSDRAVGE